MSHFRSKEMHLYKVCFNSFANAHQSVRQMGSTRMCQFIDLNPRAQPHRLLFAQTVSRCVAAERKIEAINKEYARNGMEQIGPRSLRDLDECIRCIAQDKNKNQNKNKNQHKNDNTNNNKNKHTT